jgi:hypothetical protein
MHLKCRVQQMWSKCWSFVFEFVILPVCTVYAYMLYRHTANSTGVRFIINTLISIINILICRILTLLVAGDSGCVLPHLFIYLFYLVMLLTNSVIVAVICNNLRGDLPYIFTFCNSFLNTLILHYFLEPVCPGLASVVH